MKNVKAQAIVEVLNKNGVVFTEKELAAIDGAFCTRGAYAGYLYKNKPNGRTKPLESAAWLAMQPNPFKVGMVALMMLFDEEKALFDKLSRLPNGEVIKYPAALDKDKETLTNLGVW